MKRPILIALAALFLLAGCSTGETASGETDGNTGAPDIELVRRLAKDHAELTYSRDTMTFSISTAETGDFVSLWELSKWEQFTPKDGPWLDDYFSISGGAGDDAVEVLFGAADGEYQVRVDSRGLSAFFKIPESAALTIARQLGALYPREPRDGEQRALSLLEEYALELYRGGWRWIPEAQTYDLLPVTFEYLPEGSEYGGVFIMADPGLKEVTIAVQFWCDPDRSWLLMVTQCATTEPDKMSEVLFSADTETGPVRDTYPWAENVCTQEIIRDGVYVLMYMLAAEGLDVWDCGDIMRTLQFPE